MSEDDKDTASAASDEGNAERLLELLRNVDSNIGNFSSATHGTKANLWDDARLSDAERTILTRTGRTLQYLETIRRDYDLEKQNQQCDTFDDRNPSSREATIAEVGDKSNASLQAGSSFGRYEVVRQVGCGGFATVFLAHDPSLDRSVALKILRESATSSDEVTRRFDREAKAAALLNHPNIVPVFETGNLGNSHYIATAYCNGQTLEQWHASQNHPVSMQQAALIVAILADAIEHAHQRGIVHRDLKPANILLAPQDENDAHFDNRFPWRIMITDFGLARLLQSQAPFETSEGAIIGTPAYMSPEQARGDSNAGPAVDIYSLGVVLYELLTGQVPLVGTNHIETLLLVSRDNPKSPRQIRSSISKDMEAICLTCLEKNPDQRYTTAYELGQDLRRLLAGETVKARRITVIARATRWCARNPGFSTAFLVVVGALAVATLQWNSAVRSNLRAERHLRLSQDVISEMATRVAENPELPNELRKSFTERAVTLQKQLLLEEPGNEAVAIQTVQASERLFVVLFELSEFEEAIEIADQTLSLLEPFGNSSEISAARQQMLRHKAGVLQTKVIGQVDQAKGIVAELHKSNGLSPLEDGRNLALVGSTLHAEAEPLKAIEQFKKALVIFRTINDHDARTDIARTTMLLALAEFEASQIDEAALHLQFAMGEFELLRNVPRFSETFTEDVGRCQLQLARIHKARVLQTNGDFDAEALEQARQYFLNAAETYRNVQKLNPGRLSSYGLEMMTLELHVDMEFQLNNPNIIRPLLGRFTAVIDATPVDSPYLPMMRRIHAQAMLKLVELLNQRNSISEANEWLEACVPVLNELQETQADLKDLPKVVERYESLRSAADDASGS